MGNLDDFYPQFHYNKKSAHGLASFRQINRIKYFGLPSSHSSMDFKGEKHGSRTQVTFSYQRIWPLGGLSVFTGTR